MRDDNVLTVGEYLRYDGSSKSFISTAGDDVFEVLFKWFKIGL